MSHPGGGVGTGTGRIKIGDGTTAYTSLPYFINPDNFISNISTSSVTFTATSETNNTTLLGRIVTGAALNTIIASIKNLFVNIVTDITYQEITYENWLNLSQQEKENGNWDVTGAPSIGSTASGVTYNNTTSGLSATTVQGAIDEVNGSLTWKTINNSKVTVTSVTETAYTFTSVYNELKTAHEIVVKSDFPAYIPDFHLVRGNISDNVNATQTYCYDNYTISVSVRWDIINGKVGIRASKNSWNFTNMRVNIPANGIYYR